MLFEQNLRLDYGGVWFNNTKRFAKYRDPANRSPIEEYLKLQGRFKSMTVGNIAALQADLQHEWDMLARME